jgi:uncharacterized protein involved in exopolysaccharide biosynthesis
MQEYDDIDLRPYLVAVARRWYWVVGVALLAALLAAGISNQLPKAYTATSSVLLFIRQTGSQVGANDPLVRIETIDVAARRQGLLALAGSSAIETQIAPADLQRVAPAHYTPGTLTERITITSDGDLLTIAAVAPTPEQAQALADIWASTFVSYADTLYTDEHSEVQLAGKALLPTTPSEPQIARNVISAGLLGSLLATLGIMLWAITRRSTTRQRANRSGAVTAVSGTASQTVSRISAAQRHSD